MRCGYISGYAEGRAFPPNGIEKGLIAMTLSHELELFAKTHLELRKAIRLCIENRLQVPGLTLIFVGIDSMTWLDMPPEKQRNGRADFLKWADKYVLPRMELPCKRLELYSARCGFLHSLSGSSDMVRDGLARKLNYEWSVEDTRTFNQLLKVRGHEDHFTISILDLCLAFEEGVLQFQCDVEADPDKTALVSQRVESYYTGLAG